MSSSGRAVCCGYKCEYGSPVCPSDTRLHVQSFDIESGCDMELLNLNPDGWIEGESNERNWKMLYGMDVSWHRNLILAGDSHGLVHAVDPRANKALVGNYQLHKKGNKVRVQMGNALNQRGHATWLCVFRWLAIGLFLYFTMNCSSP